MSYKFNDDVPIYLQIIEHLKLKIISKQFLPNQKIPSVRELSFEFEVNPNTVQKALAELESLGLIYTERTNGKFVTQDDKLINSIKTQTTQRMIDEFFESMSKIGIDKEQALNILVEKGANNEHTRSQKC